MIIQKLFPPPPIIFLFVDDMQASTPSGQASSDGCHIRIKVKRQASAVVTEITDYSFAAMKVTVAQSITTQPYS